MNTETAWESAQNQINNLNTSRNKLMKDFPKFPCFRKCSMTKNKSPEMPEINKKLFNNKYNPLLTITVTRKLLMNYQFDI